MGIPLGGVASSGGGAGALILLAILIGPVVLAFMGSVSWWVPASVWGGVIGLGVIGAIVPDPKAKKNKNANVTTTGQEGVKMKNDKGGFDLDYRWPQNQGASAFPRESAEICKQLESAIALHQTTSVLLILSILGLLSFFVSQTGGIVAVGILVLMVILKVWVVTANGVRLNYTMDQNWKNYANTRMAPFTYMAKCVQVWEVTSSTSHYGQEKKYHAGCGQSINRRKVNVDHSFPFPFKTNVNGYVLNLNEVKFVFLPDCVYAIKGGKCCALPYEQIKWQIGMTSFVESDGAPPDSQVVGQTWQYVNKSGGPDRRFRYNPQFPICRYGELTISFSRMGSATLQLSGTKMAEGIMRLNP